jgi:hypothetical protein
MTKITKATIKKFIRENEGKIFINVKSSFSGMTDCIESVDDDFSPALKTEQHNEYNLGIMGNWVVNSGRNWFGVYEDEEFKGFEISNCCGRQILAVRKAA